MKKLIGIAAACVAVATAQAVEGERTVFAHYMTCFYKDVATYKKEMFIAQQYGVEGWALNCGNWKRQDPKTGEWRLHQSYVAASSNVFAAAEALGTNFKIFFSPDGSKEASRLNNFPDMGVLFYDRTNLFRYGGRPFISGWGGGTRLTTKYIDLKLELVSRGVGDYLIVPQFEISSHPMYETVDLLESDIYRDPQFNCDGIFFFGCDNSTQELVDRLNIGRLAALKNNKIYMAGPCPAYNSSNLRDYQGVAGYAQMWKAIVENQPELVEIVTWNDNGEDSGIFIDGWTGNPLPHDMQSRIWACRDEAFLDITAYFAAAYKSRGRYPLIVQDKIYAVYRPRSKNLTKIFSPEEETPWTDYRDTFLQIHDDVKDNVYMSALLTAPATMEIAMTAPDGTPHVVSQEVPAGFQSIAAPMVPGATPVFTIRRGGRVVVSTFGRRQIAAKETERNSLAWGYNGTQRMWTQCAVAGEPLLTLDAANGTEWKLPKDFKAGSYSFRVKYANASDEEARYSLYVDLPWLEKTSHEHVMPLYLPPTGGETREVAFLWTIPKGATGVRIVCDKVTGKEFKWVTRDGKRMKVPLAYDWSDWGGSEIKSVALIRNEVARWDTTTVPAEPEMVRIPGGTFTMGANAQEPDEGTPREVTVSPFLIGKYEITNREFEEFNPEHRALRSATSWRDDDPVIYVSWLQAREYCNWLSKKQGLTPAYDEANDMARIPDANGYRLPTEAEWEYVASGRGENRLYPWGNTSHAKPQARSVAVRGADLTDVSRDGVYDMGGNVCEWCEDNYHYEGMPSGANPVDTRPAKSGRMNFRSIRGGSFGYYGSPRVCDREFNSPRYRGYIYIGFRVCRPAPTPIPTDAAHAPATRHHEGIPSIAVSAKNGRMWCTWYGGPSAGEDSNNYAILATSMDGGATWQEVLVADPDGKGPVRAFDPEVWIAPDGRLRWTWSERFSPLACESHTYSGCSADATNDRLMMVELDAENVPTGTPEVRNIARGIMMCKPIVRKDGTWLLPVAHWFEAPSACVLASTDGGKTFVERGGVTLPRKERSFDEHQLIELRDGRLRCYMRTNDGPDGIWEAESADGGYTWSTPKASVLQHTSSRAFVTRLASGRLLFVKNGRNGKDEGRLNMTAYLSDDDGQTWPHSLCLGEGRTSSYPDGQQLSDGRIVVICDDNDRLGKRGIFISVFREEDILAGRLVSPEAKLNVPIK